MAFVMFFNMPSLVFVLFPTFTHSYPVAAGLLLSERDEAATGTQCPQPSQGVPIGIGVACGFGAFIVFESLFYLFGKKARAFTTYGQFIKDNMTVFRSKKEDRGNNVSRDNSTVIRMDNVDPPQPPPRQPSPPQHSLQQQSPLRIREPSPVAQSGPSGHRTGGPMGARPLTRFPVRPTRPDIFPTVQQERAARPEGPRSPEQGLFQALPRGAPGEPLRKGRHNALGPPPPPSVPPHRVSRPSQAELSNNARFRATVESVVDEGEEPPVPDHSPAKSSRRSFQPSVHTVSDEGEP